MPPIGELTRIEQVHLDRLEHQGIFTTGLLLEVSETPTRRQTLADQVDASTNEVLTWRDEALMLNLASFGPGDHQLSMQAGRVTTSSAGGRKRLAISRGNMSLREIPRNTSGLNRGRGQTVARDRPR